MHADTGGVAVAMRLFVCSDSHGRARNILRAVEQQPQADAYVFLGDGVGDAAFLLSLGKPAWLLRGNCDGDAPYPLYESITLVGKTILCTHGHQDGVKFGLDTLLYRAKEYDASICLFGHTHAPFHGYKEGIHLFNPGSIREGAYGFVDIVPNGVVCWHIQLHGQS